MRICICSVAKSRNYGLITYSSRFNSDGWGREPHGITERPSLRPDANPTAPSQRGAPTNMVLMTAVKNRVATLQEVSTASMTKVHPGFQEHDSWGIREARSTRNCTLSRGSSRPPGEDAAIDDLQVVLSAWQTLNIDVWRTWNLSRQTPEAAWHLPLQNKCRPGARMIMSKASSRKSTACDAVRGA